MKGYFFVVFSSFVRCFMHISEKLWKNSANKNVLISKSMSYQLHVSACSKSVEKSLNQIHLTEQRKEEKKRRKINFLTWNGWRFVMKRRVLNKILKEKKQFICQSIPSLSNKMLYYSKQWLIYDYCWKEHNISSTGWTETLVLYGKL